MWERIFKKYGLTKKDYENILESQDYGCAICGRKKDLVIDHDHDTNQVRGILCRTCNSGLGKLGDTLQGLRKAIDYLKGIK